MVDWFIGFRSSYGFNLFSLLFADAPLKESGKKFATLGFLGSYGHTQVGLGALPLAVDTVNKDPTLLPGKFPIYLFIPE